MSATRREKNQIRRRRRRGKKTRWKHQHGTICNRGCHFIKTRILPTLEPDRMQRKAKKDNYYPIYAAREGQQLRLCVSDLEGFMVLMLPKPPFPNLGRTGCIIPPTSGRPWYETSTWCHCCGLYYSSVGNKPNAAFYSDILASSFFDWGIWYKRAKTDMGTMLLDCLDRACEWFDGWSLRIVFQRTLLLRHRIRKLWPWK